jgi:hypothetical protein
MQLCEPHRLLCCPFLFDCPPFCFQLVFLSNDALERHGIYISPGVTKSETHNERKNTHPMMECGVSPHFCRGAGRKNVPFLFTIRLFRFDSVSTPGRVGGYEREGAGVWLLPEVHLFIGNVQSIPMDKKRQQAPRVKHDCPICEQCQAASIKVRPDGSYVCNRCGYDSATGKKK